MKITPFWKLYGTHEKGFCLFEILCTKFTYMADYDFWSVNLVIFSNRIELFQIKVKKYNHTK